MFINKTEDGKNNRVGEKVFELRKQMKISQRILAEKLQLNGLDVDKNAVQRIECGKRFVTDIDLVILCRTLNTTPDDLLEFER